MIRSTLLQQRRRGAAALLALALAGAAGLLTVLPTRAEAPLQQKAQAPGWYRMQLGSFEITALYDGYLDIDSAILKDAEPVEIERLLARSFQRSPNMTSINAYLVNTGGRLVLVDAGAASLFGPTLGRLLDNLKASGYRPEQVDAVLITHLHGDHVGGITADGRMAFPNATVHVDRRESDHWLSRANLEAASKDMKAYFEGAQSSAAPYIKAGRWKTFDGDAEFAPGVRALSYGRAPGHTPGHAGYMIESGGRKLLVWGDVVHSAAVQFERPEVTMGFDLDGRQARATRERLFDQAAREGWLIGAAHISFPGLGHIRKEGAGYAWVPVEYGPPR